MMSTCFLKSTQQTAGFSSLSLPVFLLFLPAPPQDPVEYDVDLWNAGRDDRAIVHIDLSACGLAEGWGWGRVGCGGVACGGWHEGWAALGQGACCPTPPRLASPFLPLPTFCCRSAGGAGQRVRACRGSGGQHRQQPARAGGAAQGARPVVGWCVQWGSCPFTVHLQPPQTHPPTCHPDPGMAHTHSTLPAQKQNCPPPQERDIDEEGEVWREIAAARSDLFLASRL